jgi:cell division control protein 12
MSRAREKFEGQMKQSEQKFRDRLAEKVKQEDSRFRQWEQRLVAERSRLMKNLETEHAALKTLAKEIDAMESRLGHQKGVGNGVVV